VGDSEPSRQQSGMAPLAIDNPPKTVPRDVSQTQKRQPDRARGDGIGVVVLRLPIGERAVRDAFWHHGKEAREVMNGNDGRRWLMSF
jgi:hypothetical protein